MIQGDVINALIKAVKLINTQRVRQLSFPFRVVANVGMRTFEGEFPSGIIALSG